MLTDNSAQRELTPRQAAVVAEIALGKTWKAAAAATGVSEATIARWMRLEQVRAAVREQQAEIVGSAARAAVGNITTALSVLLHVALDVAAPASARVAAARGFLDTATRLYQVSVVDERLDALEAKIL